MRVLLVEWLGRGGIAQCTEAWAIELADRGHDVSIACPPAREVASFVLPLELADGRLRRHRSLVEAVLRHIRNDPPDVVVLNNYLIPMLETPIARETRRQGVRLISVIHNVVPHSRATAWTGGLRRVLQMSDAVVVHSRFEERRLIQRTGILPVVIPHPMQVGMLGQRSLDRDPGTRDERAICQFGIMKRRYKGAAVLLEMANLDHRPWRLRAAGVGAPEHPSIETIGGFLRASELVDFVRSSSVAVFPYRHATQSGGVVLAKALGVVPVATSVGALPEQISDGRSGLLMGSSAVASDWLRSLRDLEDDATRWEMAAEAQKEARSDHDQSIEMIHRLLSA